MERICNKCGTENKNSNVPFVVYQATAARQERQIRRMWIVVLVLIVALIASNLAWIVYESSFEETITTEEIIIDADNNGNANYIGQDGNIYNGENNN